MYLVLLMKMLFASTFTMGKAVLQYLNPIFFTGLRMTIGGLILLAWLYFFKREKFSIKKRALVIIFTDYNFSHIRSFCF
jgi:EamA-like transporter family.